MKPIVKHIIKTYLKKDYKGWPHVYWAIDLHDTIIESNPDDKEHKDIKFINQCIPCLQQLTLRKDTKLILFTSSYEEHLKNVHDKFKEQGIFFYYTNKNLDCANGQYSDFSSKFYYDILIDDKAGFTPNDWLDITDIMKDM